MKEVKFRAWEKKMKQMIPVYSIDFKRHLVNMGSAWRMLSEVKLLQYIYIKDNNKKEIFEGDVVECCSGECCQGFREYHEIVVVDSIINAQAIASIEMSDDIYVLGNIYENPELVSKSDEPFETYKPCDEYCDYGYIGLANQVED